MPFLSTRVKTKNWVHGQKQDESTETDREPQEQELNLDMLIQYSGWLLIYLIGRKVSMCVSVYLGNSKDWTQMKRPNCIYFYKLILHNHGLKSWIECRPMVFSINIVNTRCQYQQYQQRSMLTDLIGLILYQLPQIR